VFILNSTTLDYIIYSDDALKDPALVPPGVFRDFIFVLMKMYKTDLESDVELGDEGRKWDASVTSKNPDWALRNGSIGLRKDAPQEAVENWKGYMSYLNRVGGMPEDEE